MAAFTAVPEVLQKGKVIDYQNNWKGRRYDTAVIAAPVSIANDLYFEGIVLIRDGKKNKFYVHEVLTQREGTLPFKTGAAAKAGGDPSGKVPSIMSLLDGVKKVKNAMDISDGKSNNKKYSLGAKPLTTSTNPAVQAALDAKNGGELSGKKYSIVEEKGSYKVIADRGIVSGLDTAEKPQAVKEFIFNNLRGNTYNALTDGDTIGIAQKNKTVQKLYRPGVVMKETKYNARMEAITHLDEVIQASKFIEKVSDKNSKHGNLATNGIDYRTVDVEVPVYDTNGNLTGGEIWKATITVLSGENGKITYDISRLNNITEDTHSVLSALANKSSEIDRVSLKDSVAQHMNVVNTDNVQKMLSDVKEPSSGIVLPTATENSRKMRAASATNETQRTGYLSGANRSTIESAERLSKELGIRILFYERSADKGIFENGFMLDGTVYINTKGTNPFAQVFAHELTHTLEGTKSYAELRKLVLEQFDKNELNDRRKKTKALYESAGIEADIDAEIVANYVAEHLLTDENAIYEIAKKSKSLIQKIKNFISELLEKITGKKDKEFLEEALKLYEKALGETGRNSAGQAKQLELDFNIGLKKYNNNVIINSTKFPVNIQLFAEKDIKNQKSISLIRAIHKLNRRIEEHNDKIANPKKYIENWSSLDSRYKNGLKKHWEKEIRNFEQCISDRIDELKLRGDYNE